MSVKVPRKVVWYKLDLVGN